MQKQIERGTMNLFSKFEYVPNTLFSYIQHMLRDFSHSKHTIKRPIKKYIVITYDSTATREQLLEALNRSSYVRPGAPLGSKRTKYLSQRVLVRSYVKF